MRPISDAQDTSGSPGSAWNDYVSGTEIGGDYGRHALLNMPAERLLLEARTIGLSVESRGDKLRIQGPSNVKGIAEFLIKRKSEILLLLQGPKLAGNNEAANPPRVDTHVANQALADALAAIEEARQLDPSHRILQSVCDAYQAVAQRLHAQGDPVLLDLAGDVRHAAATNLKAAVRSKKPAIGP